ncbi:efflux RND transporter periplasmic adaptor subunit [Desulfofalx alkaliphila]|uniref:efflux RND transporter periplasmic adaptor subunit n=1 Tax=Desulfofalx alkaliphila TaxID=105483 RepID=UPI0004E1E240|nr:efflux RND transporter periplasmic adaptor subunit [Desulfofalx alkaliphila]
MKLNKKSRILLAAGALVLALAVFIASSTGGVEVDTVPAVIGEIRQTVKDTGYVQPANYHRLFAEQQAKVVDVPVKTGATVSEGQTLVVMSNQDLEIQISEYRSRLSQASASVKAARAAVEQTRIRLNDAVNHLQRMEKLHQAGAATQVEYEDARLAVEGYRHMLEEQNSMLENSLAQEAGLNELIGQLSSKEQQLVVKSPVDGIVLELAVKEDQIVSLGQHLITVSTRDQMEVQADILSDDLANVKVGQRVKVSSLGLGNQVLAGKVKEIYPQAEERVSALGVIQRRVPVIISLEETANLQPGYEVTVAIETMSRNNVVIIPRESLRTSADGKREVLVVKDGRVKIQQVTTGIEDSDKVEITNGLKEGDIIIRDGGINLSQGSKVKLIE